MSESEAYRNWLFEQEKVRLAELALRSLARGFTPVDFLVVSIEVDDPNWRPLVDDLMPSQDWQAIRDQGLQPIARGSVLAEVGDLIGRMCPDLAPAFAKPLPPHAVRAAVLAQKGASLYHLHVVTKQPRRPTLPH